MPVELLHVATLAGFPVCVWDLYHRVVAMIQNTYTMATLVVYGVHTRGFRFDKPLGLCPRALSKPEATRVYPINHSQPSYNYYIYVQVGACLREKKKAIVE